MVAVTIRKIPEDTHEALKQRAKSHGRSTEAEMREILQAAVNPPERLKLGNELRKLGEGIDWDGVVFERDRRPAEPADFD